MTLAHAGHYVSTGLILFVAPLIIAAVWIAVNYVIGRRKKGEAHEPSRTRPVRGGEKRG